MQPFYTELKICTLIWFCVHMYTVNWALTNLYAYWGLRGAPSNKIFFLCLVEHLFWVKYT